MPHADDDAWLELDDMLRVLGSDHPASRIETWVATWLRAFDAALRATRHPRVYAVPEPLAYDDAPRAARAPTLVVVGDPLPRFWARPFPNHNAIGVFIFGVWPEVLVLDLLHDLAWHLSGVNEARRRANDRVPDLVYAHVKRTLDAEEALAFCACLELDEAEGKTFDVAMSWAGLDRLQRADLYPERDVAPLNCALARVGLDPRAVRDSARRRSEAWRTERHRAAVDGFSRRER